MLDPLSLSGPPHVVLRAHAPWHLFEASRTMPIYEGRQFAEWTTIEGPAPARRGGRYFCGYSGGHYAGNYGTGEAVADSPLGPYVDLRGREGPIFATTPGLIEGPGHFSIVRPDLWHDWIVLHGRRPGETGRRVWLCPASWNADGIAIGPLTDQPQPAPPLPTDLSRLADDGPKGWTLEEGHWHGTPDGLELGSAGVTTGWRDEISLAEDWVVEAYLRFPTLGPASAGLVFQGDQAMTVRLNVESSSVMLEGADGRRIEAALPTLGDQRFDLLAFHSVVIHNQGGQAEIRIDGCVVASSLPGPRSPSRLGIRANGPTRFDAISMTRIGR